VMKIAHFAIFSQYGGSGGAETILTSKYSGSTSSVSKMVDFGPPGAEKLIFSDKTSSSLIDCSPKLREKMGQMSERLEHPSTNKVSVLQIQVCEHLEHRSQSNLLTGLT